MVWFNHSWRNIDSNALQQRVYGIWLSTPSGKFTLCYVSIGLINHKLASWFLSTHDLPYSKQWNDHCYTWSRKSCHSLHSGSSSFPRLPRSSFWEARNWEASFWGWQLCFGASEFLNFWAWKWSFWKLKNGASRSSKIELPEAPKWSCQKLHFEASLFSQTLNLESCHWHEYVAAAAEHISFSQVAHCWQALWLVIFCSLFQALNLHSLQQAPWAFTS